jgi:hypothetical protein
VWRFQWGALTGWGRRGSARPCGLRVALASASQGTRAFMLEKIAARLVPPPRKCLSAIVHGDDEARITPFKAADPRASSLPSPGAF